MHHRFDRADRRLEYGQASKIIPAKAVLVSDEELVKSYSKRQGLDKTRCKPGSTC